MESVFYENGLEFSCVRCSRCCRHEPGYVFLSQTDVKRLVAGLGIRERKFRETYCRDVPLGGANFMSLKEKSNYDCIFWEDEGCSVYEHRPLQCRTYPFWAPHLESADSWELEKQHCPGIGKGKRYTKQEIEAFLAARLNDPPIS